MGLGHLQLSRPVKGLSSSEYQRILLIRYFSYQGSGDLFILDEPTLGLSLFYQKKVLKYLRRLRNKNNTIVVIDHSKTIQTQADWLIKIGPGAGEEGGKILFTGKEAGKGTEKRSLSISEKKIPC